MNFNRDQLAELQQLCESLLDGEIDDRQYARLEQWILDDADARAAYVQHMATASSLRSCLRALPAGDLGADALAQLAISDAKLPIVSRLSGWSRRAAAMAAVLIIGVSSAIPVYWFNRPNPIVLATALSPVAWLQPGAACRWGDDTPPLQAGAALVPGKRLELAEGMAKLAFQNGTTVVIAAPSLFEILGANSLRLDRGTVAVKAHGPIKDFRVLTPDAAILDLGTSFGVHCDGQRVTDVEVFEGAVEVRGRERGAEDRLLGVGASARVHPDGNNTEIKSFASDDDRFGDLLERLWDEMRLGIRTERALPEGQLSKDSIEAGFADPVSPDNIDIFDGAAPGEGWVTSWLGSGNPKAEIRTDRPLSGENDPYLQLEFSNSFDRTIGREFGAWGTVDPQQPYVVSWKWRLDEVSPDFGHHFRDRIHFYGNPYFRRNSWPTNSWLIGVVGAEDHSAKIRKVHPQRWYIFDGASGEEFESSNMVDTGMPLKAGVTYEFRVTVFPQQLTYDVVIIDDEQTFSKSGLTFRSKAALPANVLHFGFSSLASDSVTRCSLDSIQVQSAGL